MDEVAIRLSSRWGIQSCKAVGSGRSKPEMYVVRTSMEENSKQDSFSPQKWM